LKKGLFLILSIVLIPVFSAYAQDISEAYAYPVPFRPNFNKPAKYGTDAQGITFTKILQGSEITIYTVTGEEVIVLNLQTVATSLVWDTKNDKGEKVASGVYVYVIEHLGKKKTGRLVIIR
jgi:hypothetical protein